MATVAKRVGMFLNAKRVGHEGELGHVSVRRTGVRFRYACSRGHEFDGQHFHDDAWVRARHGRR